MNGTLVFETIDSRVLRGNALGDPAVRTVPVWLPPSYERAADRRYPVIYLLAGYGSTGKTMFQGTPWQEGLAERLERLVGSRAMGEVIVVAPDCFTKLGGSQYLDAPATGAYETHLIRELVPEIDRRFRTLTGRFDRGVGGRSSGGYGALVLAMRNPGVFGAVACHAGDAYFELSVIPDIAKAVRTLRRHGGISGFITHFYATQMRAPDDITTMMLLAYAGCYSPEPSLPHGFALPFDVTSGELNEDVWRRWKAWDPVEMVAKYASALRELKLLFIDAGTRDEWNMDLAARILVGRLAALGISHEHQEFDGGHRGTDFRYDVSLPKMAAALGARAID